jgi:hypothetical protein
MDSEGTIAPLLRQDCLALAELMIRSFITWVNICAGLRKATACARS